MPIFDIPVREFPQHVLSPLVRQYTSRLIQDFNLQDTIKDNIHIKYGFSAGQKTKDYHKNIAIRTNRVDVDVEVNMNPDNQKWDITNFKFNPGYGFPAWRLGIDRPLFQDPEAGIYLYLHEVPCTVTMNITFTLMNKTTAYMLQSAHYELHGSEDTPEYGDFMFDLPVNREVIHRLKGLFDQRRLDPEKVTFPGYLYAGSITKIGYRINRTATDKEFVIRQHKLQILEDVALSNDKPQEVNEQEGTVVYTVPFTYTVQFARPAFYTMKYPIVVMNKLIPVQHLPHSQEIRDNIRNIDYVKAHLNKVTYQYWEKVYRGYDHLFVSPFYEDWREPSNTEAKDYTQRPFWIITVLLDEDEKGGILPETWTSMIGEIVPKYQLHPIVEDIILTQGCESYEPDCLFNISVYRDDELGNVICYHKRELDWDIDTASVIIRSTNRAQRYHIVLSEMIDLNFLNPKWYFLLERYSDFFKRNDNDLKKIMDEFGNGGWIDHGYFTSTRVFYCDLIPRRSEIYKPTLFGRQEVTARDV